MLTRVLHFSDILFSIRQLRKSPGFALTAILTLALGIGAVTSVFSVVNAVLLKPFAFREPGRLVVLREVVEEMRAQYPAVPFNYRHYLRLKKNSKSLQDAAIFQDARREYLDRGRPPSHYRGHRCFAEFLLCAWRAACRSGGISLTRRRRKATSGDCP